MNILSNHMPTFDEMLEEEINCSVCDELFVDSNIHNFICNECRRKLSLAGCACGSDDIQMDWGVELSDDPATPPYYWEITCYCGEEIKSRLHGVNEVDEVAKEIFSQWINARQAK